MAIKYIDIGHFYINSKGIVIPSVSDLVNFHFPNTYQGVDPNVLREKANYGTKIHEVLEKYDNGEINFDDYNLDASIDPNIKETLRHYIILKNDYKIDVKSQEQIIDYEERFAGRYDKLDKNNILWDVKTTAKKMEEKWACQLGYYYLALGYEKEIGYVLWLPKNEKYEVVMIKPWENKKCIDGLNAYEKHIANE